MGQGGLSPVDETARTCDLGIAIGARDLGGHSYGREAVAHLVDDALGLRNFRRALR